MSIYPRANVIVERKHRHVLEMELTLLAQAKMPIRFWYKAFFYATFIMNKLPTLILSN